MTLPLPPRGLYAITPAHCTDTATLAAAVTAAVHGGAAMVQYRAKPYADREQAVALAGICRAVRIPFIVNDDPALALAVNADGVHLGREDVSVAVARGQLGHDAIVGVSCYNELERARAAARDGASYVAFGSFFASPTKPHAVRAPVGLLQDAREICALPIVAIGGITPENGAALIAAGADMLAVIDGVFGDSDPESAARRYAALFQ